MFAEGGEPCFICRVYLNLCSVYVFQTLIQDIFLNESLSADRFIPRQVHWCFIQDISGSFALFLSTVESCGTVILFLKSSLLHPLRFFNTRKSLNPFKCFSWSLVLPWVCESLLFVFEVAAFLFCRGAVRNYIRPLFFEYLFYKPADHSWNSAPGNKIDIYSFYYYFPADPHVANPVFSSSSNCLFRYSKYIILTKTKAYRILKRKMHEVEALLIQCIRPY